MMKKLIILTILLFPSTLHAQILINELAWMGTENSSSDEWIELYNSGEADVDLTDWKLEATDGSPSIQLAGTIETGKYFLLERTDDDSVPSVTADLIYTGALGNTGEWLKLINSEGITIDEINANEGWPAGDNSTKQPMERVGDAWQTSPDSTGTPKAENSQTETNQDDTNENTDENTQPEDITPPSAGTSVALSKAVKGDIIITEIFPNPAGIDIEKEFIEIKNVSGRNIDLTNWIIKNLAKQEFTLPSLTMTHNSIVVFYRTETRLALNNNKEKITLYNVTGRIINRVEYKSFAAEDMSYQVDENKKWRWSMPSAGEDNTLEIIINPVANIDGPKQANVGEIITFDGSDSFDPKNREFKLIWNFGERKAEGLLARNIFFTPGTHKIKLKVIVSDKASSTDIFKIKIIGEEKTVTATPTSTDLSSEALAQEGSIVTFDEIPYIFISEFLPNPEGKDLEGEFIEIFNNNQTTINLKGWKLTDGSRTFTFGDELIKPNQYLALFRPQTKIALNNNTNEEIKLLAPNGEIADLVSYEKSKEGYSYVLDENFIWQQTSTPTPGEINVLDEIEETDEDTKKTSTPKVLGAEIAQVPTNEPQNKNKYFAVGITGIFALGLGVILKRKK